MREVDLLITPAYLDLQRQMHQAPRGYGGGGYKWAWKVSELIAVHRAETVLDYGCGEGTLGAALGPIVRNYDPAIPGIDREPQAADIVVCTDVLEHVERECIFAVLKHLRSLTLKVALVTVAIRPANKRLPDGRNAHILQRPARWWWAQWAAAKFSVETIPALRAGELAHLLYPV
jgi:Methyltransferase domain